MYSFGDVREKELTPKCPKVFLGNTRNLKRHPGKLRNMRKGILFGMRMGKKRDEG